MVCDRRDQSALDSLLAPQSPCIRCGPSVPRSQKRGPIWCLPRSREQGGRAIGGCHLLQYHARILGWRALPKCHHEASATYGLPRRPSHFHHHYGKRRRSAAGAFGHFREMANHDRSGKLRWREIVTSRSTKPMTSVILVNSVWGSDARSTRQRSASCSAAPAPTVVPYASNLIRARTLARPRPVGTLMMA